MLYTEDTRIAALAVHIVGNKAKDEPLLVSPALSGQVGDTGLMQTLTAYFAGGFKSEEYYNLHHETDLACNEVYNFVCKVFDDRETFYDNSVGLARHLYETGTHPQIKGGEFYVVYFTGCRFGGEAVDAVGLFKSETRDTFLDVGEQDGSCISPPARESTSTNWTKGASCSIPSAKKASPSASWTTPTGRKRVTGSTISCMSARGRTTTTTRTTSWPCARNT